VIRSANDYYSLGVPEEGLKLMSAFGGGLCCGKTCGAVCGAMAAFGKCAVGERAHATEGFKERCIELMERFEAELGTVSCAILKEQYFNEDVRCIAVVERVSKVFEQYMNEYLEETKA